MGDKPSKSQSDDETLPPYLSRSEFQFDSAAARLSFSGASFDASRQLRPRLSIEELPAGACDNSIPAVNGSVSSVIGNSPEAGLQYNRIRSGSNAMASPKRQTTSRLASPDSGHEMHLDRKSSAIVASSSSDSKDKFRVNSGDHQHSVADVHFSGNSDGSLEPPSPSTSSTKTVISVIHVQDAKGWIIYVITVSI